jgi:hypothetical protein
LRVIVETRKPEIRIPRAERRGDEVQIAWDIRDDNPDLNTFRLEYRSPDVPGSQWTSINVTPALQGETAFRPVSAGAVQVRVVMTDLATNIGQFSRDISAAGIASPPAFEQANAGPGIVAPPPSGEAPFPVAPPPGSASTMGEYRPAPAITSEPPARQFSRPVDEAPSGRQMNPQQIPTTSMQQTPVQQPPVQPMPNQPVPLAQSNNPNGSGLLQTSSSGMPAEGRPSYAVAPYAGGSRSSMPAVEIVNKKQPRINFQVGKYGPSGLGSVDVYVTTDDGATWSLSPGDHNVTLPSPSEIRGGSSAGVSVMVDLKDEGVVYGYYVVVKSRAGLGIRAPEPGTVPQVRLELDISAPVVELYVPQPDSNRRDALLLTWKATDAHLANNPVTIEWAERIDGQWNTIGTAEMANTGQFSWQVPVNIPPAVFLRMAVRDVAGNSAVAQTKEPVVVDLSVPEPVGFKVSK